MYLSSSEQDYLRKYADIVYIYYQNSFLNNIPKKLDDISNDEMGIILYY